MVDLIEEGSLDSLSSIELISIYINDYDCLDESRKLAFEALFRRRRLPLPHMRAKSPGAAIAKKPRARKDERIDRSTFIAYLLLIYTGSAIFYSWVFILMRLIRRDYDRNRKHKIIQTGIALFYIIAELLALEFLLVN